MSGKGKPPAGRAKKTDPASDRSPVEEKSGKDKASVVATEKPKPPGSSGRKASKCVKDKTAIVRTEKSNPPDAKSGCGLVVAKCGQEKPPVPVKMTDRVNTEEQTTKDNKKEESKSKITQSKPPARISDAKPSRDVHVYPIHPKPDKILITTLKQLKIKSEQRSESAKTVNELVNHIIHHMKGTTWFKDVNPLRTGSYYEHLKIGNPDEFDIMFTVSIERVDICPFGDDGAFYSVEFKRGKHALDCFLQADTRTLSASDMLTSFRNEIQKCVKGLPDVVLEKKKKGCPAVTLRLTKGSVDVSLDIVLGLEVGSSWPKCTMEGFKIDKWLGTKVKKDLKFKHYFLVPKYEGIGTVTLDGVCAKDTWRISFSHVEKIILTNHGSAKTCCEAGGTQCCRKKCLKLLKHLLNQLKSEDPSLSKFCSYLAKTTLLHACCIRTKDTDWEASQLGSCFQQLLADFEQHLIDGTLPNFFIPTHNLLGSGISRKSCNALARRIKERNNGFPIFRHNLGLPESLLLSDSLLC
ncbi:hypothetical protein DPEC_G00037080 [Dallia pectoralis]|uniref:Uncharacterized protein n=1 Tax=Dallia pectoralis TaxID=75939 RepID=A0ACC2HDT9_DALPE|nr:hypothetical protein DPEC_G00037080 [Dallia pectoralis]